jgi:hemerythrin-like domain-containing protein
MLTATYILVALSVEQASIRLNLLSFQKYVHGQLQAQRSMTLAQLQYACDNLNRLYETCHWRKIERYLIPAIRQAAPQADRLLDELGALNASALEILVSLQTRLDEAAPRNDAQVSEFCDAIDAFCSVLLERLKKEEGELFAVARRAICGEAWFNIAHQFLRHDAQVEETRRRKRPALTLASVTPRPSPEKPQPAVAAVLRS